MHEQESAKDFRAEIYSDEGCFVTELSNTAEDADASIVRARVLSGAKTRSHRLNETTERYVILSDTGPMEVDELPAQEVAANDVVLTEPSADNGSLARSRRTWRFSRFEDRAFSLKRDISERENLQCRNHSSSPRPSISTAT